MLCGLIVALALLFANPFQVLIDVTPRRWQGQREGTPRRGGSLHVERAALPSPFEATLERALSARVVAASAAAAAAADAGARSGAMPESAVERLARRISIDLYDSATGSMQGSCTLSGARSDPNDFLP